MSTVKAARIYIVDDNASARRTVAELLASESYTFLFAESGQQLLAELADNQPDVILLDVMMPGMDGFETCHRVKTHAEWRHIPIILITALDDRKSLLKGLESGADEFLAKPVNGAELRARVRTMLRIKRQYDALKDSLALRDDMVHMIVHDLKNPLSTLAMFCEMIEENPDVVRNARLLERANAQLQTMQGLVNDLLVMAKTEQGSLVLNRQPQDICALAQELVSSYRDTANLREIELVFSSSPQDGALVKFDANLFRRVLDNLLSNAVKFSPDHGQVVVQVDRMPVVATGTSPEGIIIRVKDQGPGVPAEYRDRIFDKFEVVRAEHSDIQQLGLGLAFCKMVVDAHGGRIYVDENQPHGSVFSVEL